MKNNKTLGLSIRFWTNDMQLENKKACWDSGIVSIEANNEKGIKSVTPEPFNNLEELDKAVFRVLRKAKIIMLKDFRKGRL